MECRETAAHFCVLLLYSNRFLMTKKVTKIRFTRTTTAPKNEPGFLKIKIYYTCIHKSRKNITGGSYSS